MDIEAKKLTYYTLLKDNPNIKNRSAAQSLEVSEASIAKWKTSYNKAETKADINKLINAEDLVMETALELTDKAIDAIIPDEFEEVDEDAELTISNRHSKFKNGIVGLRMLQDDTQELAGSIVKELHIQLERAGALEGTSALDYISKIANVLDTIQKAFFTQNVINVFSGQESTEDNNTPTNQLSDFYSKLRS